MTLAVVISLVVLVSLAAAAITFGGPADPPPMPNINNPFKHLDYSDLPAPSRFAARTGGRLAFRAYSPAGGPVHGSVVLVHGSSATSSSMHVMAKAMAAAGYEAYALDVRGHGESGAKGQIAYVGQLEDDLEDFMRSVKPAQPATLIGFSSGGGFALRFAGSERQELFASYVLLSPFISHDAPSQQPSSGGWVNVGVPRIVALTLLNAVGMRAFNDLPVVSFALDEEAKALLTPHYSYALAQNFRPRPDYRANIRAARRPMYVIAGTADEAFRTETFDEIFRVESKVVPVSLLPGTGHIQLILDPVAVQAAVDTLAQMNDVRHTCGRSLVALTPHAEGDAISR